LRTRTLARAARIELIASDGWRPEPVKAPSDATGNHQEQPALSILRDVCKTLTEEDAKR
jgi:hypothetical protein